MIMDQLLAFNPDVQAVALRSLIEAGIASKPAEQLVAHLLMTSKDTCIHIVSTEVLVGIECFSEIQVEKLITARRSDIPEIRNAANRAIEAFNRRCKDQELVNRL